MSMNALWSTLDVGCGRNPLLGANVLHVDLFRTARQGIDIVRSKTTNPSSSQNAVEVICDSHFLPFKDKAFQTIFSAHMLEHVLHPVYVLMEFKRVGKHCVLTVPNGRFYERETEDVDHLYTWNATSLERLLYQVFDKVEVSPRMLVRDQFKAGVWKQLLWLKVFLGRVFFHEHNELIAVCS